MGFTPFSRGGAESKRTQDPLGRGRKPEAQEQAQPPGACPDHRSRGLGLVCRVNNTSNTSSQLAPRQLRPQAVQVHKPTFAMSLAQLSAFPFYRRGSRGTERLSDVSEVTHREWEARPEYVRCWGSHTHDLPPPQEASLGTGHLERRPLFQRRKARVWRKWSCAAGREAAGSRQHPHPRLASLQWGRGHLRAGLGLPGPPAEVGHRQDPRSGLARLHRPGLPTIPGPDVLRAENMGSTGCFQTFPGKPDRVGGS